MKKVRFLCLAAIIFAAPLLHGQPPDAVWDSVYDRWDLAFSVSGGVSYGFRPALYPSIDLIVYSVKIDDFMPVDFGVSARGFITAYSDEENENDGWLQTGMGLAATLHVSFNNLKEHSLPFMENFDFYIASGPVYNLFSYRGKYKTTPPAFFTNGIGLTTAGGVRYFFLDWLAVNVELFNWRLNSGLTAGLTLNF